MIFFDTKHCSNEIALAKYCELGFGMYGTFFISSGIPRKSVALIFSNHKHAC